MRSAQTHLAIAAAVTALVLATGCSNAKAAVAMPESTPLTIPQAPPRVVMPPAPEPPPVVTEAPQATSPTTSANPPPNGTRTNPRAATPPPPANPPAANPAPTAPAAPATPLETPANQGELEQRTQGLLSSAKGALAKINYPALSADGKAQHDTATRFVTQAEAALKAKNVVYAWQLADKANTIATLLLRHS